MRPSLVTPTLNPCVLPRSVTTSSTRLGSPTTLSPTSCPQPADFVKTSTDLFATPFNRLERASPALVRAAARRNSLRLETGIMPSLTDTREDARKPENLQTRGLLSIPAPSFPFPASNIILRRDCSANGVIRLASVAPLPPPPASGPAPLANPAQAPGTPRPHP